MPAAPRRLPTRHRLTVFATVLLAAGCASGPPAAAVPEPGTPFLAGYHPYWAADAWSDYPLGLLDQLFLFEVELTREGTAGDSHGWPERWMGLREAAASRGVQVIPTVTLHGAGAFDALFSDPAASRRAVETVVELLGPTDEIRGIHLDIEVFEPVSPEARDGYTAFVAALRSRLRQRDPGVGLSIFTLAFDDADAYNERALSSLADFLVVQGYDLHHQEGPRAGPVGALEGWGRLNWSAIVDRYDALGVPRSRMVMGVPLYGYEWPTESGSPGSATRGTGMAIPLAAPAGVLPDAPRAWREAERHGLRRDPESGIPYYAYQSQDGGWIQGWFEDRESLKAKVRFVRSRGLAGMAFFPLAYGAREVWSDVRDPRPGGRP